MYLNRQNIITVWGTDALRVEQIEVNENFVKSVGQSGQETQPSPTVTDLFKEQPSILGGKGITFLLFICLLFLTMGFIVKIGLQKISSRGDSLEQPRTLPLSKNKPKFAKYNPQIACRQCQFFSNNRYLKCAVHPDKVLKKEAQDCLDYQEKSNLKNHN